MSDDAINSIEQLGMALLTLIKSQSRLVVLEAALAKQSIIPFLVSIVSLFIIGIVTWMSLSCAIGYLTFFYTQSIAAAILCAVFINIIGMVIAAWRCMIYINRIGFSNTRESIKEWIVKQS